MYFTRLDDDYYGPRDTTGWIWSGLGLVSLWFRSGLERFRGHLSRSKLFKSLSLLQSMYFTRLNNDLMNREIPLDGPDLSGGVEGRCLLNRDFAMFRVLKLQP